MLALNITMGSKNLEELLQISGCKRNCRMTEYTARDMGSTKGLYGNDNTSSYVVLVMLDIILEKGYFSPKFYALIPSDYAPTRDSH